MTRHSSGVAKFVQNLRLQTVNPYQNEGSKKSQVAQMFTKISGSYDFLNSFLSLGIDRIWRKKLVASLPFLSDASVRFLDLAAGTCALSLEAVKSYPHAQIDAVDISEGMLQKAEVLLRKKNKHEQIRLKLGDAEALDFSNDTFDAIFIGFGVRNFENVNLGLAEMYRVLKPGGALRILEFSKPRSGIFKYLFNFYFRFILPVVGNLWSKDKRAYTYLFESVQQFPDYERFIAIMESEQFADCQFKPLTFGICTIYSAKK
ncbi:MAG: bifunctional demethylmenaquinone methyltransferase/2-methoxy-6-polyprenyl-1,4-benzoquinol methylase UbiE [Saprospiraceae bacterium]|nr:bifunctional demethylmenaquinone methyltransferase/2-methoxy-6-polyprenyl-1,4-benzoquinol methylase UbiE [Saprospiraceae bacterium]